MLQKLSSIILILFGESLSIYAEVIAAEATEKNFKIFELITKPLAIITLGGVLMIGGYIMGFKSFKNIWIVTAISISSIIIIEPIINYIIFKQIPTRGALVGLILGNIGLISAITIK